jgi:short subunit dehydrogenase-like uncharacterized protein
MSHTILLYGATGYSGRLIAAEGAQSMSDGADVPGYRMVLAGRDGREVARLAREHGMEARVFGIEDRQRVISELRDVDVVINAAGPFALTAGHLAKGALGAGCHYVDINSEAEVYMKLDDLGRHAAQRGLAMVSGAGHTAAASDLLLHAALDQLRRPETPGYGPGKGTELGAVRIAVSRIISLSRGSLETLWRSLREQVRVVRAVRVAKAEDDRTYEPQAASVLWHEPVGKLERTFDFFDPAAPPDDPEKQRNQSDLRIASAANLVDTLTARLTLDSHGFLADRIESYLEAGSAARAFYQLGPLLAPLAALPLTRDLARVQLSALPVGPTPQERRAETHCIVLEIEDAFQTRIVHWGWHTPNPYDFTAQVVVQVARAVASGDWPGWRTPAEVLRPVRKDLTAQAGYLRGCHLHARRTILQETAR